MLVTRLEGQVHYLQNLVNESGDQMLEIVKGTIPIAGRSAGSGAGTGGVVTHDAFDGYKAEQKRVLAVLKQEIGGGVFTIGLLDFTTVQYSISYCGQYFPPGSYDCIVGLVILQGSVTDSVVSHDMVEGQMLLGKKIAYPQNN